MSQNDTSSALTISIIVPFRNRGHELETLLASLAPQRDAQTELILINDASDEDVSRFAAQADIWLEQTVNCGPSYARNIGALRSRGDILLFLDSDVALLPGCLAALRRIFATRPDIHALGGSGPPDATGQDVRHIYAKHYSEDGVNTKQMVTADTPPAGAGPDGTGSDDVLIPCDHVESAFLAVRRAAFMKTGGFDPYWFYMGEDRELCLNLRDLGYRVHASWPTRAIHFEAGAPGRDEAAFTRFLYTRYLEVAVKRGGVDAGIRWLQANNGNTVLDETSIAAVMDRAPELARRAQTNFLQQPALDAYLLHRCRLKAGIPDSGAGSPSESDTADTTGMIHPTSLVLFVTSRCNARCAHCFIDHTCTPADDAMTQDDIAHMLHSLRVPLALTVTGGEPTLRPDFDSICHMAMQAPMCSGLSIMTNGSRPDRIATCCEALVRTSAKPLRVQISIDGPRSVHDARRNVPGLFDTAMETARRCHALSTEHNSFSYIICITVGNDTLPHVPELVDLLQQQGLHAKLAVARSSATSVFGVPRDLENPYPSGTDDNTPAPQAMRDLMQRIEAARPGFFTPYQAQKLNIIERTLTHKKRMFPCHAGFHDAVVYDTLDIALCEHVIPLGNLRQWGLDIPAAWNSLQAWQHRARLTRCACIHGCNISTALTTAPSAKTTD